jgi:ATP-dependent Clp protease ATP-binding subunit ClpA
MIFMTSNLGAREIGELMTGGMGFAPGVNADNLDGPIDHNIQRTAIEAARRKFSPEFMNRIDKIVVFRSLSQKDLRRVLDIELAAVQQRIDERDGDRFDLSLTDSAKEFLLAEGTDYRYGARRLKRSIERFLVHPLANLCATGQVALNDALIADLDESGESLTFLRDDSVQVFVGATMAGHKITQAAA